MLASTRSRFTIVPFYFRNGFETVHAAPYVVLGLATLSFFWVSVCLFRGRAWGGAATITLALVSLSGFSYACSSLQSASVQLAGYNAARGLGLMLEAFAIAAFLAHSRMGRNRTFSISEVSAIK